MEEQEVRAVVAARKELGGEHEDELIAGFLDRLDKELTGRKPARPARPLHPIASAGMRFALTIISLIAAIPITAIALTKADSELPALAIAWAGIVAVNYMFSRGSR
jgi:hypothetical protein